MREAGFELLKPYFQFHPLLGITPLPQVQNPYHGNLLVLQEKFDN